MKRRHLYMIIMSYWCLVAFPTSHPITSTGGYTGAPQDSFCTTCHQNQNQNLEGDVHIKGIPPYVFQNETYPLSIEITSKNGTAFRAGFQMLALEEDLSNAGLLINNSNNSVRKVAGGKRYLGHNPAVHFNNDTLISWSELWNIEENDSGLLSLYIAAILGSGDQGNSNDRGLFKSYSTEVRDSNEAIWASSQILLSGSCGEETFANVKINDFGGVSPISYNWNTGDSTQIVENLNPGTYYFTVSDQIQNKFIDSISIIPIPAGSIDSIHIQAGDEQRFSLEVFGTDISSDYTYFLENKLTLVQDSSTNSIFENLETGEYLLFARNNTGCTTNIFEVSLDLNTQLKEEDNLIKKLEFFPNPASEYIQFNEVIEQDAFGIYDIKGQKYSVKMSNKNQIQIDHLPNGMYILMHVNSTHRSSSIFIKH